LLEQTVSSLIVLLSFSQSLHNPYNAIDHQSRTDTSCYIEDYDTYVTSGY